MLTPGQHPTTFAVPVTSEYCLLQLITTTVAQVFAAEPNTITAISEVSGTVYRQLMLRRYIKAFQSVNGTCQQSPLYLILFSVLLDKSRGSKLDSEL